MGTVNMCNAGMYMCDVRRENMRTYNIRNPKHIDYRTFGFNRGDVIYVYIATIKNYFYIIVCILMTCAESSISQIYVPISS